MTDSKYPNYADYLGLDKLLDLQRTRSDEHDETLFIIVHQVYELWFKQLLHEIDHTSACLNADDLTAAQRTLRRILTILKVVVAQIDVLETMTPLNFLGFRDRLASSSGLQSFQFREFELALGMKRPDVLERYTPGSAAHRQLQARLTEPSLWHAVLSFVSRAGFPMPEAVLRDESAPTTSDAGVRRQLLQMYRTDAQLAQLCERLVDLDEGVQEWRYRHLKMVERTIGSKPGTGGTEGTAYLASTLNRPLFPDLWSIRAEF